MAVGGESVVRTKIQVDGEEAAKKALKDLSNYFKNMGDSADDANVDLEKFANITTGLAAGMEILASAFKAAADVGKALATVFAELASRGSEVIGIRNAFQEMADPGLMDGLIQSTRGLLGSTETMQRASRIMRTNLITDQQEIVEWFDVTTRAATSLGVNISDAIEGVTEAVTGAGFGESFERLGINVLAVEEATEALGLEVSTQAGTLQALRFAMAQLQEDLGPARDTMLSLGAAIASIGNAFKDWFDTLAQNFASNEALVGLFNDLNDVFRETLPPAEEMADIIAEFFSTAIQLAGGFVKAFEPAVDVVIALTRAGIALGKVQAILNPGLWFGGGPDFDMIESQVDNLEKAFDSFGKTIDGVNEALDNHRSKMDELEGGFDESVGGVYELDTALSDLQDGFGAIFDEVFRLPPLFEDVSELTNRTAEANIGLAQSAREAAEAAREEAAVLSQLADIVEDTGDIFAPISQERATALRRGLGRGEFREQRQTRNGGGDEDSGISKEGQKQLALLEAAQSREVERLRLVMMQIDAQHELDQVKADAHMAEMEALAEYQEEMSAWYEKQTEETQRQLEAEQELIETRFDQVRAAVSAAQDLSGQISEVMNLAAERKQQEIDDISATMEAMGATEEEIAKATKAREKDIERLKKAEGAFLVAFNIAWAAVEVATAIKEFASQKYVSGAMHLVSATAYGVAAGIAAARLGGGSASGGSISAAKFTPTEEEKAEPKPGEAGSGGVTILQQYSLGPSEGELAKSMQDSVWEQKRSGMTEGGSESAQYGV